MKILLVEDDLRLAKALVQILEHAGHTPEAVHDGETGLQWAQLGSYDLLILDVMLPKLDGFSIASQLRREGVDTPILMLTARSAVSDRVTGLDSGADDYLTKPFEAAEFLARIRALGRRQGKVVFETLTFGDLSLDLESLELSCSSSKEDPLRLSPREFELMRMLLENPGRTISKDQIIDRVWDNDAEANSVEAYVSFLRKKLAFLGSKAKIETLRGAGYRLAEE